VYPFSFFCGCYGKTKSMARHFLPPNFLIYANLYKNIRFLYSAFFFKELCDTVEFVLFPPFRGNVLVHEMIKNAAFL